MEITEWVPGSAMGVRHSGIVTGTGVFTLEPLAGGTRTRFTWAESLDFPWYFGGRLGASRRRPAASSAPSGAAT